MFILLVFSATDIDGLKNLITESAGLDSHKKIEIISSAFLNTPFKESSIGEGDGIDPDPLINLEFMDCVTFIEYIIAFVNSENIKDFEKHILNLRYKDGRADFYQRLHLPDFQWFPKALNNKYLVDITDIVGSKYVKQFNKTLYKDFYIGYHKVDKSNLVSREAVIRYIPREDIENIYSRIPEYSVIRILRKDSHRPYVTTHMGIVIKKGNKKYLRHSSRHFGGKVTDTPLNAYFSTFEKYEKWEALGIAIYKIGDIGK
ncbi:MAG: DUF1460 domain-containing protein [Deltaproteobacteria bacterium]|nr:DUF1460 domain-containing protein [Deltaproteobacteria bacterium]